MKNTVLCALCALSFGVASQALAQDTPPPTVADGFLTIDAEQAALAEFKWVNRVVVVFADSPRDPAFSRQIELLAARPDALTLRDVVVVTDTDPSLQSDVRTQLRPRGFALVIIDKDGRVMMRKPDPWDVREITRAIDKTPLRQQEIRQERIAPEGG